MLPLRLLLITPVLAAATDLNRRDATPVNNDITSIDIAVRNLTAMITAYNGGIQAAAPIFDVAWSVHAINRKGFTDTTASTLLTSAESMRLVQNVEDSGGVSIPAGSKVLESKKALFEQAQIISAVDAFVNLLKGAHETFCLAVATLLSADQVVPGGLAAGKVEAMLTAASLCFAVQCMQLVMASTCRGLSMLAMND